MYVNASFAKQNHLEGSVKDPLYHIETILTNQVAAFARYNGS